MPLIIASHDSLPYIDRPPSPTSLAAAQSLITASLDPSATTETHPLLPPSPTLNFTPLALSLLQPPSPPQPLSAIDLSRYELSSSPPSSPSSTPTDPNSQSQQPPPTQLQTAYTYLTLRNDALHLLDAYGKNAYLVANSQLEYLLEDIEGDLVRVREEVGKVNRERKGAQEGKRREMEGGEERWREGVGRLVEVLIAEREVEERVLERLRGGGG